MGQTGRIGAGALALACLFLPSAAHAQDLPPIPVNQEAPGAPPVDSVEGVDLSGSTTHKLNSVNQYPVSPGASVSIANEFGKVHVKSWDNPVVKLTTEITVGAQDPTLAERFAQSIDVNVDHSEERLDVKTVFPIMGDAGNVDGYEVHHSVLVPRNASVQVKNFLGDTLVESVDGAVGIDAQLGVVELKEIGGRVNVRAKGEYPLVAHGLDKGGVFDLSRTHAVLSEVSGKLDVHNFLGKVEIHAPGTVTTMDITSASGPIDLYLPPGAYPDLDVRADFGFIDSEVMLDSTTVQNSMRGRYVNTDATQRITMTTSFDSVRIHRVGPEPESELMNGATEPLKNEITEQYPVADGADVLVDAMVGDVRVEGADVDEVTVKAVQYVRTKTPATGRDALDSLTLDVESEEGAIRIRSDASGAMESLEVADYRVDLEIQIPRTSSLQISAEDGTTRVSNTGGPITVRQRSGEVRVEHAKGELDLHNDMGDILALDCAGPVDVRGVSGTVTMRSIYGNVDVTTEDGKTIVDTVSGAVDVESLRGDVRVIAIQGIGGNYQIHATDGDVSMVLSDSADTKLLLTAKDGGRVFSAVDVTGKQSAEAWIFQGMLNSGTRLVEIETVRGDIIID